MRRREAGLFLFALAIFAASLLTETRSDVVAASRDQNVRSASTGGARALPQRDEVAVLDVDAWLGRLKARNMNTGAGGQGLFGGTTWQPPQPAAAQPSKPQTPPFPFRLLGRMTLGGSTVIILSKGEQTYPVKVGDVIEQFRIDRIDDEAMRVTYVPTGEGKDFRNEDLYPSLAAAFPNAPPTPQPVDSTPPAPLPQQAPTTSPVPVGAAARTGFVPGVAASAAPAVDMGNAAAGRTSGAATSDGQVPLNQMPGTSAPIGGMVINPAPPGSGMLVMPTAPSAAMNIQPAQPGAAMVMTPPPPGIVMPGMPATALGSPPVPGSQ